MQARIDHIFDTTELPRIDSNLVGDLCRPISTNDIEGVMLTKWEIAWSTDTLLKFAL